MAPRSKRQRKQKDRLSVKGKQAVASTGLLDVNEGAEFDPNAFIIDPKAAASAAAAAAAAGEAADAAAAAPGKKLTKSQQRKRRRVEEEKEMRQQRAKVMATLSEHQLGVGQLGLLRSTTALGQKDSKKQALKRALQLQRAGVDLPGDSDVQLLKERKAPPQEPLPDSDSQESSSDDEMQERRGGKGGTQQQQQRKGVVSMHDDSASSSDEEEEEGKGGGAKHSENAVDPVGPAQRMQQLRSAVDAAKSELHISADRDADMEEAGSAAAAAKFKLPPSAAGAASGPPRVVVVQRTPGIDAARENLPIIGMEQEIMEAIAEHDVVVLCGETGCGKTTQVPQFLYEAGYGSVLFPERAGAVGITQPRRVAAASTATRVAEELGSKLGDVVGYQVRFDRRLSSSTALKFMTDGILLREVQDDFLLRQYSAIIVDEAHERSLNTDILLGMLSRVVTLRRAMAAEGKGVHPLKLIIMSATLRTADFLANKKLFPTPPPLVEVPARQYPVTVHFARRTEMHDYVSAAYRKVSQIHRNLPPGGILVFLTGQREVEYLCRRLRQTFAPSNSSAAAGGGVTKGGEKSAAEGESGGAGDEGGWGGGGDAAEADAAAAAEEATLLAALERDDLEAMEESGEESSEEDRDADEEEVHVLGGEGIAPEQLAEAEKRFSQQLAGAAAGEPSEAAGGEDDDALMPLHVLPLYAMLPAAQQARVFRAPPPGHRLVIVATNVAETSLTIPGMRYVVDAGRSKQRLLESAAGGLARYEVRWVSKASAAQRAGRAGRTGPGHCYRLFSSAHFNDTFPEHTPPEISNTALEGVALSLKALGVERVANFPFPTAPEAAALVAAERCLVALSALEAGSGRLTPLGAQMAKLPISPRHARMLLHAAQRQETAAAAGEGGKQKKEKKRKVVEPGEVLRYAVALAAALSVESPFLAFDSAPQKAAADGDEAEVAAESEMDKERARKERAAAREAHARLRVPESDALSAMSALCAFEASGESEVFCRANALHFRTLREAAALRKQLCRLLAQQQQQQLGCRVETAAHPASPPPLPVLEALRRSLAAGWADQVARRVRSWEHVHSHADDPSKKKSRAVRYQTCTAIDEEVYLHPRSTLHASAPEMVIYSELVRTEKRPYMSGVTAVSVAWLATAAAPLCAFSRPLDNPPPFYSPEKDVVLAWRDATYGRHLWPLPRSAAAHPELSERCAVFAAALLGGEALPGMAALRPALALPPGTAAKPEMRGHRRVSDLIAALQGRKVDSKAALGRAWRADGRFLKAEMAAWLQKGSAARLEVAWPGLQRECGVVVV